MTSLLLVMAGGAIGAGARHGVGTLFLRAGLGGFPWATLSVNIAGGLLMGVLAGLVARAGQAEGWRLFLGVGVLGGFTTFSAFSLELVAMIERGEGATALAYVLASVIGAAAALWAGLGLTRVIA